MSELRTPSGWQRFAAACVRGFHAYAGWLVSIGWGRFALLSVLLIVAAGILQDLPPFSWSIAQHVEHVSGAAQKARKQSGKDAVSIRSRSGYEVRLDDSGVHIGPRAAASAASVPASSASAVAAPPDPPAAPSIDIRVPKGASSDEIKSAVEDARQEIEDAVAEAEQARADAEGDAAPRERIVHVRLGDYLVQSALLFIIASAIVKINYKGRIRAEAAAAQATEAAESESLKRQVVEARMAAMQAQVEPHFLFNTLASIDHLIETDPARASAMQKNLIALLRASMPTLRETNAKGVGHLGRELAVVRPYLEILKVRMEERLQTEIDVPEGLLSADFPPMMIQGLVENAIKHGLEPKPEGGRLTVRAEIVHGKLAVSVADTGLGFGKAATAGTGTGLDNIRQRLQLLYGRKAQLVVAENAPSGTRVTISVPYATQADAPGASGEA